MENKLHCQIFVLQTSYFHIPLRLLCIVAFSLCLPVGQLVLGRRDVRPKLCVFKHVRLFANVRAVPARFLQFSLDHLLSETKRKKVVKNNSNTHLYKL
jgi:hypothetical protein